MRVITRRHCVSRTDALDGDIEQPFALGNIFDRFRRDEFRSRTDPSEFAGVCVFDDDDDLFFLPVRA